ncbi:MAG: DUF2157 domain-containing protein [Acidobacteria bacterium]|nr:DUF2157 domain-containing protein [Acidobacteriota bacterium]
MRLPWEKHLEGWLAAGLLDPDTAARIRAFEAHRPEIARLRWPVLLALCLGGILLGAGVLLFVTAHWENISPFWRMALIALMLTALHAGGLLSVSRLPAMATTLHTLGTIALGGGIALAGQVFHIQEHWPNAILLWALGAWAGIWLLGDWPQISLAALLTPAWLVSEWGEQQQWASGALISGFLLLLSLAYLSAWEAGTARVWRKALTVLGAVALLPCGLLVSLARPAGRVDPPATFLFLLLPVGLAWVLRKRASWPVAVWALWVLAYVLLAAGKNELPLYAWCAVGAIGLVGWGLQEGRPERVNLGVAGFAVTVLFFYFSRVMTAMDRSLSLILLGVLFLAGGWQLERLRRRLLLGLRGASS